MAGGKETPRQKMIGMMYLVLTALLAMNISKDVLNAFVQINKSLGVTNGVLETKAQATLEGLRNSKEAEKAAPFLAAAEDVSEKGDEMVAYIEEMKARVMAASMKGNKDGAGFEEFMVNGKALDLTTQEGKEKVTKPDENQNNTTLLIGPKPEEPRSDPFSARELRTKLEAYRDYFKTIKVTNVAGKDVSLPQDVIAAIDSAFVFPDVDNEGVKETWESNRFYHTPLVAVLASLSKVQADVLNAKTSAMTALASSINMTDLKFTDVTVAVVPKQSYVLKGDSFVAEIYLAAYNKNSQVRVYMGGEFTGEGQPDVFDYNGKEAIPSNAEGKCKFKQNTGSMSLGEHGYKGVIVYKDANGEDKPIAFAIPPFFVGEPALVVSPTQMNVFYRGLDNPVEVSVPGVDRSALKVSMDGGTISGPNADGTFTVKPGTGNEGTIKVSATINGKDTQMPPKKFRIKKIPDPVPSFAGKKPYDSTINKGDAAVAQGVRADMENFDFNVTAQVISYKVTITNQGSFKEFPVTGRDLPESVKENIKKARTGEKIFFEEIMVKMPDGTTRKISPITLKFI